MHDLYKISLHAIGFDTETTITRENKQGVHMKYTHSKCNTLEASK